MITLTWIEQQIEDAMNGSNTPSNVRDYALLCIARDNLRSYQLSRNRSRTVQAESLSPNLESVPTIDQVADALCSVSINSKDDAKKARDMRTWADIIKQKR